MCVLLSHQVLAPLINDALLSDVTMVVGGESFYAHRVLLASWSPVFRSMLTGPFSEAQSKTIELHDIEVRAARSILDRAFTFVIVDRLLHLHDHVPLFSYSIHVQAPHFLRLLQYMYTGQSDLTLENSLPMLALSNRFEINQLEELCTNVVTEQVCMKNPIHSTLVHLCCSSNASA